MVMAKYVSVKWIGNNDNTDETYILEYMFQNN